MLLLALLAVLGPRPQAAWPQAAGPRIALLIGNPVHPDADASESASTTNFQTVADRLAKIGFSVTKVEGATRARMSEAIRDFVNKTRPGTAALFFFRGAMLRVGQKNFLMPIDAQGPSEAEDGIELNAVESDLSSHGAAIKIIIVDAAESDGGDRYGPSPSRPAALELHEGTLAIINTGLDKSTGSAGGQSPAGGLDDVFLDELLKQTAVPNVTVEQAFAKTRVAVARATAGRQVPSVSSSLLNDFYFSQQDAPPATPAAPPASPPPAAPASPPPAPKPPPPAPKMAEAPPEPAKPASAAPAPGETFKDCESCPEMVVVPPGEFTMGATDTDYEKPPHKVTIAKPFAIGRHEVTFAQWDACAAAKACKADIDDHGFGRAQQPVIDVSWDEAQAFLKWLSAQSNKAYRLPSEAEWEYAARAGSRSAYSWGPAVGSGKANCSDCSPTPPLATLAVGSFRPNAFGLYDTAGNAAEFVDDCWNATYKGAPADGSAWRKGDCQLRVLRGGAFGTKANAARSSARFRYDRDVRYYTNGFRVARDLP